jgi:hypothetical protein
LNSYFLIIIILNKQFDTKLEIINSEKFRLNITYLFCRCKKNWNVLAIY